MGVLGKSAKPQVRRLPRGTFTVDSAGQIISSTVPQSIPAALVEEIGREVLTIFIGAREAHAGFGELVVQYASFKITAREMRGGAIIFLSPSAPQVVSRN